MDALIIAANWVAEKLGMSTVENMAFDGAVIAAVPVVIVGGVIVGGVVVCCGCCGAEHDHAE